MKRLLLLATLALVGCTTPSKQNPDDAFFSAAAYQALWFDATAELKGTYPTGIKSVDEILVQVPSERRQAVLDAAISAWRSNKNATANSR